MNQPTIKIILRSNFKRSDGSRSICLRYIQNRKVYLISLNIPVLQKNWDKRNGRLKQSTPDSYPINTLLDSYENKAKTIRFDHRVHGKPITYSIFKRLFRDENYGNESFYTFVESRIKEEEKELAPGTMTGYNHQLNKLRSFQGELQFNEITGSFIEAYQKYLAHKRDKPNNSNSIAKSMSFIRSMLYRAKKSGLIDGHVFENEMKVARIEGDREFLNLSELGKLEELFQDGTLKQNKQNVLRYFLFACYTGLRYSDIREIRFCNIQDDNWISLKMVKTKDPVRIPIIPRARRLLTEKGFESQKVFRVLTDQPTNRYLKEIIKTAGISKRISFHCARHTYATCSMDLGISLEVVSRVLGHTDIKTTAIYAKIRDGRKEKEMQKWDK